MDRGVACTSTGGECLPVTFTSGTAITLIATPDWKSVFAGWTGACTGTGDCSITLTGDASVMATFNIKPLVKQPGTPPTYFATIQDAYNAAADGTILEITANSFAENLVFNRPVSITLDGGKDEGYTGTIGTTTVQGSIDFVDGTVDVKAVNIE